MASPQIAFEPRPIGQYLPCSATDIERALSVQVHERSAGNAYSLGQILVAREVVTAEALAAALAKQRSDRLQRSSLLASLSEPQLALISGITEEIGLSAGETLFREGHCGDSLFVVTSGRILMSRQKPSDGDQPVAVALPGDVLGEKSYFSKRERTCTAWALEPVMLLRIRYDLLSSLTGLERNLSGHAPGHRSNRSGPLPGVDVNAWIANITGRITRRVCRAMQVENAFIYIREPHTGDFVAYVKGPGGMRKFRSGSGQGIVGEAANTGKLILLADSYFDSRFTAELDVWTDQWTRTLMAGLMGNAPKTVAGVLLVINKTNGRFDRDDETVFQAVAHQFSSTIEKCGIALAAKA